MPAPEPAMEPLAAGRVCLDSLGTGLDGFRYVNVTSRPYLISFLDLDVRHVSGEVNADSSPERFYP